MASLDYVEIPSYATRLPSPPPSSKSRSPSPRPQPKVTTALPRSTTLSQASPATSSVNIPPKQHTSSSSVTDSPTRSTFGNLPGMLLASTLQIPSHTPVGSSNPRNVTNLLSTRDPLSVPITTVNFRKFVGKVGPVFWVQDRLEEILMWRKGWKVTVMWMAAYAFLCYFPRLVLLLPHAIILGVLLATHPSRRTQDPQVSLSPYVVLPPPRANAREGSAEWLANIQAIQNLMGAFADGYDAVWPIVLHLSYSTSYTPHILTFTIVTFLIALPLLPLVPLRPLFLILGLTPFVFTHPYTRHTLPLFLKSFGSLARHLRTQLGRIIDDDRLDDDKWYAELREVELFENERWIPGTGAEATRGGTWSSANLKAGERVAWTRGRDGWSGVSADGGGDVSSNLTFKLDLGWTFVETEDWRADVEANWSPVGADNDGWVYTNDAWLEPHAAPLEEWKAAGGMTRRRRWTRRIWFDPAAYS